MTVIRDGCGALQRGEWGFLTRTIASDATHAQPETHRKA